ncbi:MAG: hypothetical protein ACJ8AH_19945 [Stellaceae bacterium]
MTVRQVYYQAVVHSIVSKAEADYDKIQNILTELRREELIPYEWIIDEGRFARQPYTVEGIPQALNDTRRNYRKDPWQDVDEFVQIWVEKNALVGVLEPVTREYDIALMAAVGYSSISFLHEAAQRLSWVEHPIYIYHLGDLDPSGAQAAEAIEKDLRGFASDADIHFERIAITPDQIVDLRLQAALRPSKTKDPRYRWFLDKYRDVAVLEGGRQSCELDAIRPTDLRAMVREVIERYLPRKELDATNARGDQEKIKIGQILDRFLDEQHDPEPISVCHNRGPANGEWITAWIEKPEPVIEYETFDYDAAETLAVGRMLRNDQLAALYGDLSG